MTNYNNEDHSHEQNGTQQYHYDHNGDIVIDNFCCCPEEDENGNGNGNGGASCGTCPCQVSRDIPIETLAGICDGCTCTTVTITELTDTDAPSLSALKDKFPFVTDLTLLCSTPVTTFGTAILPTASDLQSTGIESLTITGDGVTSGSGITNFKAVADLLDTTVANYTSLKTLDLSNNPIDGTQTGYDITGLVALEITTLKLNGIAPVGDTSSLELCDEFDVFKTQMAIDSSFFTYFNDASTNAIVISADAAVTVFNTSTMPESTGNEPYNTVLRLYNTTGSVETFPLLDNLEMKGNNIIFTGENTFSDNEANPNSTISNPRILLEELSFEGCVMHSDNDEFFRYSAAAGAPNNNLNLANTNINSTANKFLNNAWINGGRGDLDLSKCCY